MDQILITILNDTYSLTQLKHRLNILKLHLLQNFFGAPYSGAFAQNDIVWLKSLSQDLLQKFSKDNTYEIFAKFEKEIKSLKILTIYLTFEPDDISLKQIGTMVRKLFGNLLLDIKYDPNLIAGVALVWKGVYRNYSLKASIEDRKFQIADSFKKFLRK